jgi:hypothetical protein
LTATPSATACASGVSTLSHRSAAALWRIVPRWPSPPEVTTPTKHRRPGIHAHRSRSADATTHYGIRVTTPARTLVDLADVLTPRQLTRAVNEAQVQRLVTPAELTTLLTRPERNQTIAGHEVDAVYRHQRLVIELDSRQFHTTPTAFEQDRDRDADLLNAGSQHSASPTTASNTTRQKRQSEPG